MKAIPSWVYQICPSAKVKFRRFRFRKLQNKVYEAYGNGYERQLRSWYVVLHNQVKSKRVMRLDSRNDSLMIAIKPYVDMIDYLVYKKSRLGGYMPFDGETGGWNIPPSDKLIAYKVTPLLRQKIKDKYENTSACQSYNRLN